MSQETNEPTLHPGAAAPSIPNAHVIEERFRESELSGDIDLRKMHGAILREMAEPGDGSEPIPLWMLAAITALALFCGGYLAFFSGGFRGDVFNFTPDFGPRVNVPTGPPDPRVLGKKVFTANCVACHQSTGLGQPGQFPPLVGSEWVNEADPGRMIRAVLKGLQGPITVKGQTFNNVMVPWNSLSDEDIAAVITYVRGNKEWGNNASAVTPERVKAVREKVKTRPGPFTADELLKISPAD